MFSVGSTFVVRYYCYYCPYYNISSTSGTTISARLHVLLLYLPFGGDFYSIAYGSLGGQCLILRAYD